MKKTIALLLTVLTLTACAHKELTAPCSNIASLTVASNPCDQREPVNTMTVPSVFAN